MVVAPARVAPGYLCGCELRPSGVPSTTDRAKLFSRTTEGGNPGGCALRRIRFPVASAVPKKFPLRLISIQLNILR